MTIRVVQTVSNYAYIISIMYEDMKIMCIERVLRKDLPKRSDILSGT